MGKRNPFKKAQSAFKKYTPVGIAYDKARSIVNPAKKDSGPSPEEIAASDRNKTLAELATEEQNFQGLDAEAAKGAEADARASGTYADTPEFKRGLQSESDARARGLKSVGRGRLNALRARVGLPAQV